MSDLVSKLEREHFLRFSLLWRMMMVFGYMTYAIVLGVVTLRRCFGISKRNRDGFVGSVFPIRILDLAMLKVSFF